MTRPIPRADAVRVRGFLTDEAVLSAFDACEAGYVADWKRADTVAERELAHARARALQDVRLRLRAIAGAADTDPRDPA